MTKYNMEVPWTINDYDLLLDVDYTYTPGNPGCMYQVNGDPGWPPEGPEIDILAIRVDKQLVPSWLDKILCGNEHLWDYLHEHHESDERPYLK